MLRSLASAALEAAAGAREFSLLWGVLVPGLILLASVVFTFLLYRHFSKTHR